MDDSLRIGEALRSVVQPLDGRPSDWDALLDRVGDARFVLLGEATHGTHEFYEARAEITQRLVEEKGFRAVALEADWPDASYVNRWVLGDTDGGPAHALRGFRRFPAWMWRNHAFRAFIEALRERNAGVPAGRRVGVYGLDLYALQASIGEVLAYLSTVDPGVERLARLRYSCFDAFRADPTGYTTALLHERASSCESDVVEMLVHLLEKAPSWGDGAAGADAAYFHAVQNARVIRSAEAYYRTMYRGGAESWNLRDTHMAETCDELATFLARGGEPAKIVVWAHNSHLGDARATEQSRGGELNLGQLLTERYGRDVVRVGFTTYDGTVTAADEWGDPPQRFDVVPALEGSVEAAFHATAIPAFLLDCASLGEASGALAEPHLERAIGVVYRPLTERWSHYFDVRLPRQFDLVVHYDRTTALEPLDRGALWQPSELPEAYPSGL